MRQALKFKITNAGRAAILSPPTGLRAAFTHIAIGHGDPAKAPNAAGYQPTGAETALKTEFMRAPLGAGVKPAADQISFAGLIDGNDTGWINEIGLFLQDGTLWALWSEDPTVVQYVDEGGNPVYGATLGYKALGVPYTLSALIVVREIPLDLIDIVVNGPPINLTVNNYDVEFFNLLAVVLDQARALRALEAARLHDARRIADLAARVDRLEG